MSGVRVFISSDSAGVRKESGSILATAGCLVVGEAGSGTGVLRLIQALQPDVAVVDIDSRQGIAAAKLLEEDGQIALVLLSAYPRRGRSSTVSGQIQKPVNETALLTAVEFAAAGMCRLRKAADDLARMKETLETRKVVERAKGFLMDSLGCSEQDAYRMIQQQSMNKRRPLKNIAEAIITAHEFSRLM
ncbi:MAG: putative transcriptional regulatory protein pdtaR [Syntrophomonadaceae bacterium]|nr:putative transcriptional regulatory protein pdtaR [Bacillota bacterium]